MKKWKTVFLFLLVLLMAAPLFSAPVPDTGQTKCYNDNVEIPCTSPGEDYYGQDANYTINPMSYTKLDSSGNALSDSATSWAMVRDNVTGLIRELQTCMNEGMDYTKSYDLDKLYAKIYSYYELLRLENDILFLNRITRLIDIEIIKTTDNDGPISFDFFYRNNNKINICSNIDFQTNNLSITNISPQTGHINGGTRVYIYFKLDQIALFNPIITSLSTGIG